MHLFLVYVGGKTETSLIEVHDIHFALGEKIEDTYDQLRQQWWGTPQSLHLDAWGAIHSVDGFAVKLKTEPATQSAPHLFFVNMGGYDTNEFTELHKNLLVVADTDDAAKQKAKAAISHWQVPHKDNLYAVDACVNVSELLRQRGLWIHLEKTGNIVPFQFICEYVPIGAGS